MDLMIDIESLSLASNALVLSIGVVPFSVAAETVHEGRYFVLDIREQQTMGRHIDVSTVEWWLNQAMTNPGAAGVFHAPRTSVHIAMFELAEYIKDEIREGGEVWANGPQFDLVVLRSLFDDCGYAIPWKYHSERDMRSIRYLMKRMGVDIEREIAPNQTQHDALSDADWQARYVVQAFKHLGVEA